MHFHHFHCISSKCILHRLHGTAYKCIYMHSCMMHSDIDAFSYIHTHFQCCIWYKVHSYAFECIIFWLHFLSLLHSRAFIAQDAFMCILCMLHSILVHAASWHIPIHSQLGAFWMCCILFLWCIFMCIILYSSALRRKNTRIGWAPVRDRTRFMMRKNAH